MDLRSWAMAYKALSGLTFGYSNDLRRPNNLIAGLDDRKYQRPVCRVVSVGNPRQGEDWRLFPTSAPIVLCYSAQTDILPNLQVMAQVCAVHSVLHRGRGSSTRR